MQKEESRIFSKNERFNFNIDKHCFVLSEESNQLKIDLPMSVTLQPTRKCNLECIYCSEDTQLPEPSLDTLKKMIDNLTGVQRVIVAGGEPTLRRDLPEILAYLKDRSFPVISIASNATLISKDLAIKLSKYLTYADITIDGTPEIHNKIRGQFDRVLKGIQNLKDAGVSISLVNVLLTDNMSDVIEVCRMAESLGAGKLKILSPIRKGRGANILSHKLSGDALREIYNRIREIKRKEGWHVKITITDWDLVDEGHAILIHPDGDIVASPVPSEPACIRIFGNILNEHIKSAWKRYPYVHNHIKKYLEETLMVC